MLVQAAVMAVQHWLNTILLILITIVIVL